LKINLKEQLGFKDWLIIKKLKTHFSIKQIGYLLREGDYDVEETRMCEAGKMNFWYGIISEN
jgi:hypothetical protein